ncbi:hypothetical protein [Adhaeribacter radiodurans]|uniref:Tryptophan-rich sensory protein n=1 Tax=Adhaeribacter radiodurans TaxID=2745197 RepID=A0A7L7L5J8_9BACT|nr:hypothetical protein [Adhaeribacter radiodurans]QMU28077.1 hypothetical protein HUW48_08465 [Adhaeribacter radiodurans]
MKNIKTLAILNFIFFLVHLLPTQLTQFKLLNNQTIGDVSNKYPALFTPAGITFSIWGLIYLALTAFCIYHIVKAFKADATHEANQDVSRLGYWFILNNLATGAWTFAWVYEQLTLSVVLIFIQLITLIAMHIRLQIYNPARSTASRWFTQFPLSIYFGWICIATVANASSVLAASGWNGFGLAAGFWTIFMLGVATVLTLFLVLKRRNPFVGLVSIWAFYGINLKHQELKLAVSPEIILASWLGLGLITLAVLYQIYRNSQIRSRPVQA